MLTPSSASAQPPEEASGEYGSRGDAYLSYSIDGIDCSADADGPPVWECVTGGGPVTLQGTMIVSREAGVRSFVSMDARVGDQVKSWPTEGEDSAVEGATVTMPFQLTYTPRPGETAVAGSARLEVCGGVCGVYEIRFSAKVDPEHDARRRGAGRHFWGPSGFEQMSARVIRGSLQVSRNKGSTWMDVGTRGVSLRVYDVLRTGPNTRVRVRFDDGAVFWMKSNTQLTILPDGVQLQVGDTWFNLQKQGSQFKVVTPTTLTGSLGTEFVVSVNAPDGRTAVELHEGALESTISATGEVVQLVPGDRLTVEADGAKSSERFEAELARDNVAAEILRDVGDWVVSTGAGGVGGVVRVGAALAAGVIFAAGLGFGIMVGRRRRRSTAPRTCPRCGAPRVSGAVFCTECGARFEA